MQIELQPIRLNEPRNSDPDILALCEGTKALYTRVGFAPPWIGYLSKSQNVVVGACAFRSAPRSGQVEIVFVTLPQFEKRGYATEMVRKLTEIAHSFDASVIVSAKTEAANLAASRVLQKAGFQSNGSEFHPEDGKVFIWLSMANSAAHSTKKIYEQLC
jgi:ribosomal-protein-alanine N-acetyltransferase